jgi:hypothetical protein
MRSVFLNFPFSNDAPTRLLIRVMRDDAMFNSTINQGGGA